MFVSAIFPAPGLAQHFALILSGLCDAAAARMSKPRTVRQLAAFPLLMLLYGRLRRMSARFARLAARAAAKAKPKPKPKPKPAAAKPTAPIERKPRKPRDEIRLPRGFGWLVRLLPEAAISGSQLQYLLTNPEMVVLIAANPQVVHLLRPLCQMLAVATTPGMDEAAPRHKAASAPTPRHASGGSSPDPEPPSSAGATPAVSAPAVSALAVASTGDLGKPAIVAKSA